MKLTELAAEYRQSGRMLLGRIEELSAMLDGERMSETEKLRLRRRIIPLKRLRGYVNEAACVMERYYDKEYRNGRFSI